MADELLIRCPVCLHKHSVSKNIPVNKVLSCERCGQRYEFQNALPYKDAAVSSSSTVITPDYSVAEQVGLLFWLWSSILCLFSVSYLRDYVVEMKGPGFLGFYLIVFIILWITNIIIRWFWIENTAVSFVAFIIFEGLGVLRLIDGWSQGMRNFEIMAIMMVVGGIIFFIRAEHMSGNGSSGSGCSGCSSGGGCGGGCGGCGG